MLKRIVGEFLKNSLEKEHSVLFLGPRQVGKTTLVNELLAGRQDVRRILLQDPGIRQAYERDPGSLITAIRSMKGVKTVFLDEVQKVPELMDAVQLLIDEGTASFILTGSSARKLRRSGTNLLPGRVKSLFLDPLTWSEMGWKGEGRIEPLAMPAFSADLGYTLDECLAFGSLPGIVLKTSDEERKDFLRSYASLYLEEEIRAEALVRKIGAFSRFLELAAHESGTSPNLTKLSMEAGVSVTAIKEFYNILQETLIVERVDPFLKNARKRILSMPRYYFFDAGVRNALARLPFDPGMIAAQKSVLFEHAVMLEIIRRVRALRQSYRVCFWRTSGGAEVDCVLDMGSQVIPIEIKASERVRLSELKGLVNFLKDYSSLAKEGFVVTQGDYPERLADNITAIPWKDL